MNPETIHNIKIIVFSLSILPFLLEIFAFINILRYRRFATNIGKNTNDFFRSIKLRYTNSAKLDISIRSTKTFVEKSLLGKDGSLSYIFILDKIALFLVSINLIATTIFAGTGHIHFTYIISIMSLCFFVFRQGCSLDTHIRFIESMIIEHLENTIYHKIKPSKDRSALKIMPLSDSKKIQTKEALGQVSSINAKDEHNLDTSATPAATNHIIESILQEFLN